MSDNPKPLNPIPPADRTHPAITGDQHGRPDVPWDQWTTHCRILRNQEHIITECKFPVEYRGHKFHQICGDKCPIAQKYDTKKERKTAK